MPPEFAQNTVEFTQYNDLPRTVLHLLVTSLLRLNLLKPEQWVSLTLTLFKTERLAGTDSVGAQDPAAPASRSVLPSDRPNRFGCSCPMQQ